MFINDNQRLSLLYSRLGTYNKGVSKDCGIIASAVFNAIMTMILRNEKNEKYRGKAFISSTTITNYVLPEFTLYQIQTAIDKLREEEFIEVENAKLKVDEKYSYVITLSQKGKEIYEISKDKRLIYVREKEDNV